MWMFLLYVAIVILVFFGVALISFLGWLVWILALGHLHRGDWPYGDY